MHPSKYISALTAVMLSSSRPSCGVEANRDDDNAAIAVGVWLPPTTDAPVMFRLVSSMVVMEMTDRLDANDDSRPGGKRAENAAT